MPDVENRMIVISASDLDAMLAEHDRKLIEEIRGMMSQRSADITLYGGKAIAQALGMSERKMHTIKTELLEYKAIYYVGRALRGNLERLKNYINEHQIN